MAMIADPWPVRREQTCDMSEREPSPTSRDEALSAEPDPQETAREAAMMRKVIRDQERHREGGIEPELADDDATDPRA